MDLTCRWTSFEQPLRAVRDRWHSGFLVGRVGKHQACGGAFCVIIFRQSQRRVEPASLVNA